MNLTSARKAEEFVHIVTKDARNRVTSALVPGHKGRIYKVGIARSKGVMKCTCHCVDGTDCQGNKNNICYHVAAALMASASRNKPKVKLTFCSSKEEAKKLAEVAGRMFPLQSAQGDKRVWVVAIQLAAPVQWLC